MVTLIPGYIYSILAAVIVGTIVVSSCTLMLASLKSEALSQQLANVDEYVAAQSLNLVNHVTENGQNATQILNLPTEIGNRAYWISINNDGSNAWVESGFGATAIGSRPQIYIPADVAASGTFVSGWGSATLHCVYQNQTVTLTLTSE